MSDHPLEVEVKFYLTDMTAYEQRLRRLGASLIQPRTHELNLRFDTPDKRLTLAREVLRLRQDRQAVLTFKGPSQKSKEVSIRPELEVTVDNFEMARQILEALGYAVVISYEKWRSVYQFGALKVTLDEMPYGDFTEIEGGDSVLIQKTASSLDLAWKHRIMHSYLFLFDHLKTERNLPLQNLTFEELHGLIVSPADLGVKPAD